VRLTPTQTLPLQGGGQGGGWIANCNEIYETGYYYVPIFLCLYFYQRFRSILVYALNDDQSRKRQSRMSLNLFLLVSWQAIITPKTPFLSTVLRPFCAKTGNVILGNLDGPDQIHLLHPCHLHSHLLCLFSYVCHLHLFYLLPTAVIHNPALCQSDLLLPQWDCNPGNYKFILRQETITIPV